jgi:hypothetical protein
MGMARGADRAHPPTDGTKAALEEINVNGSLDALHLSHRIPSPGGRRMALAGAMAMPVVRT